MDFSKDAVLKVTCLNSICSNMISSDSYNPVAWFLTGKTRDLAEDAIDLAAISWVRDLVLLFVSFGLCIDFN